MKMLGATYDAIVKQFNLGRKSEFREKMGKLLVTAAQYKEQC